MHSDIFCNLIKQQRKTLGLTQEELAKKLHVTNKAVSRWETGNGFPDIGTLTKLIKVLDLNYEEVLDPEGYLVTRQQKLQKRIQMLLIVSIICIVILGLLLIQKDKEQFHYTGKNLIVSEELLNCNINASVNNEDINYVKYIKYTKDIRDYVLDILKVDTWEYVGQGDINEVSQFIHPFPEYQFSFFHSGKNVITMSINQKDGIIYIVLQDDTSKPIYDMYKVTGDIKGNLVENMNTYEYNAYLQYNHKVKNESSILEEIEPSIIWDEWDISLTEILNGNHMFVETEKELYIVIASKDKDLMTIDTKLDKDTITIYMTGKDMLFYRPYLHIFKVKEDKKFKEIRYNERELLPYQSYSIL